MRRFLRDLLAALLVAGAGLAGATEPTKPTKPAEVTVGTYVNKIVDLSFKEQRYTIDFYVWFLWTAEGDMAEYQPLESFELINGYIDKDYKTIIEVKTIDKVKNLKYAAARVKASISPVWEFTAFPFDKHRLKIQLEDNKRVASQMVFVADSADNLGLGGKDSEIGPSGWTVSPSPLPSEVAGHLYKSNFGDTSLTKERESTYSRITFSMDLLRTRTNDVAWKVLGPMIVATLVAFVAFVIKPTVVEPRFGLGVGALFAVVACAFVVASAVPDSDALTAADELHMISMAFIFVSLVQSAFCLKWDQTGRKARSERLDRWSVFIFPLLFALICLWVVQGAVSAASR